MLPRTPAPWASGCSSPSRARSAEPIPGRWHVRGRLTGDGREEVRCESGAVPPLSPGNREPGTSAVAQPRAWTPDGGRDMDAHPSARWPRPVPLIGDPTRAAERAADPSGWAFDDASVSALHAGIEGRRDVRQSRADPVPTELLRRVLAAGHSAPSVGHSQPWRFVVVTEQATRDRAAVLADRERLRQAELLTPDRRARLLDLQLDGIREAPVGVVVACDRRAPAGGVLGRATFPDTDLWSCACAIQNIWLAARAAGLGLGWVTLFQPADLAALLHLPDGVETLGWLCLGGPDERPPEPGLERHGWGGWAGGGPPSGPPSRDWSGTACRGGSRSTTSSSPSGGPTTVTRPPPCPIWPA